MVQIPQFWYYFRPMWYYFRPMWYYFPHLWYYLVVLPAPADAWQHPASPVPVLPDYTAQSSSSVISDDTLQQTGRWADSETE